MLVLKDILNAIIGMSTEQAQSFMFATADTITELENYMLDTLSVKREGYAILYRRKYAITANGAYYSGDRKVAYIFISDDDRIIGCEKADKGNRLRPIAILR